MDYETIQIPYGRRMFLRHGDEDVFPGAMGMEGVLGQEVDTIVECCKARFVAEVGHEPHRTVVLRSKNIFGVVCV